GVGPALQQRGQGVPLHQLHGEVRPAVVEGAQVVDGDDGRVLQPAADPGLLGEAEPGVRPVAVGRAQHLDGQLAPQVAVAAPEADADAAVTDLPQQLVTPRAGSRGGRIVNPTYLPGAGPGRGPGVGPAGLPTRTVERPGHLAADVLDQGRVAG